MATPSLVRQTSACWRETFESSITTSTSGLRPMISGKSPTGKLRPSPRTRRGWLSPADKIGLYLDRARFEVIVNKNLDFYRPHKRVSLGQSVLANGLFQLADQCLLKTLKALRVGGTEPHANDIGGERALTRETASEVDLAHNSRSDLDGLQRRLEGSRKRALKNPLEAVFYVL